MREIHCEFPKGFPGISDPGLLKTKFFLNVFSTSIFCSHLFQKELLFSVYFLSFESAGPEGARFVKPLGSFGLVIKLLENYVCTF